MSKVQILVKAINTILTSDVGRYAELTPISGVITTADAGTVADFFDGKGRVVCGRVVNMSDEIAQGHFPDVKGIVIDTKSVSDDDAPRKRMAQGGINRIPQRTPTPAKLNKRTSPDTKRA